MRIYSSSLIRVLYGDKFGETAVYLRINGKKRIFLSLNNKDTPLNQVLLNRIFNIFCSILLQSVLDFVNWAGIRKILTKFYI